MGRVMRCLLVCGALVVLAVGAERIQAGREVAVTVSETVAVTLEPPELLPPPALPTQTNPPVTLEEVVSADTMSATYVFAYDTGEGEMVLCTTEPAERLYPASITKLFTGWVALRLIAPEEVVQAGWELGLLQPGSSQAFIALDSRMTVEMLIEGMLLPSGNDAALVLAAAAGRRALNKPNATASEAVAEFVNQMNLAAQMLQFENSHFVNPDGYHSEEHYSCPADLARIAALALAEPVLRRCMGLQKDTVTFVSGEVHNWVNTNRLLNPASECYAPEAVGMKTGYTGSAGYCLLAAFGEDRPLVVGIFGSTDSVSRYQDAAAVYRAWETLPK